MALIVVKESDLNYKEDDKIEQYTVQFMGCDYKMSIHAQNRLIERGFYNKTDLKAKFQSIRSSFKPMKDKKQFVYYGSKAKRYKNQKMNMILVVNERQKVILTAYTLMKENNKEKK